MLEATLVFLAWFGRTYRWVARMDARVNHDRTKADRTRDTGPVDAQTMPAASWSRAALGRGARKWHGNRLRRGHRDPERVTAVGTCVAERVAW